MNSRDEIVVFQSFDNTIDANIIKARLDANDIECFLTDENLSNLYPGVGTYFGSFRVRLHLYARDVEKAASLLAEESELQLDEESINRCPKCRSLRVERDFSKKVINKIYPGLMLALFAVFFPNRKVYRCLDCETEF